MNIIWEKFDFISKALFIMCIFYNVVYTIKKYENIESKCKNDDKEWKCVCVFWLTDWMKGLVLWRESRGWCVYCSDTGWVCVIERGRVCVNGGVRVWGVCVNTQPGQRQSRGWWDGGGSASLWGLIGSVNTKSCFTFRMMKKMLMFVSLLVVCGSAGSTRSCGESRRVYGEKHTLNTAPHTHINGKTHTHT